MLACLPDHTASRQNGAMLVERHAPLGLGLALAECSGPWGLAESCDPKIPLGFVAPVSRAVCLTPLYSDLMFRPHHTG